jgi:hypothetical protein
LAAGDYIALSAESEQSLEVGAMGKQSKLGKFGREEAVCGSVLKKTRRSAALVIGLLATLITICPLTSHAEDTAVGHRAESIATILGRGCPVTHPAHAAECGGSDPEQVMTVGLAMGESDTDYQMSSEQNDSSRTLLENLMRNGLDRNDAQLP